MVGLKIARIRKNLSQTELSELSGVSRTIISFIENGKIDSAKVGTLKKLAKILEVSIEELIFDER